MDVTLLEHTYLPLLSDYWLMHVLQVLYAVFYVVDAFGTAST